MTQTVVVTRHPALVEYLRELSLIAHNGHPDGPRVLEHATVEDVRGRYVLGVLPLSLAVEALAVTEVPLKFCLGDRGRELSLEELRERAERPITYVVRRRDEIERLVRALWEGQRGSLEALTGVLLGPGWPPAAELEDASDRRETEEEADERREQDEDPRKGGERDRARRKGSAS